MKKGEIVALTKIDTFVDGAAVGKPGQVSFVKIVLFRVFFRNCSSKYIWCLKV
jgi:threonine dehydratase